jgi:hypothetical protein
LHFIFYLPYLQFFNENCLYISCLIEQSHLTCTSRVNVHNLAQVANWRSLVKTFLELQTCPLFQINILDQNPLGLLPLVKSINLKEGTQLQLQRRFYQTAPIYNLRQFTTCAHLPYYADDFFCSCDWYAFLLETNSDR